jgi:SAM-dependent methyltransferase
MTTALPPIFDPDFYRRENPALADLDAHAAARHYAETGRAAGLVASPLARRETLVEHVCTADDILEIGPFCHPLVTGPGIRYLDILDAAQLRARAAQHGIDPAACPAEIHYVGGLDRIADRFDAVVSSHAIEHQPDLVRHLEAVARLLPVGGRYYLVVPDRRYCFDHFRHDSTIADVLDAWRAERQVHGLARILEHSALATHNDAGRHWRGDHGEACPRDLTRRLRVAMEDHEAAQGAYMDVHAWYFTPDSFRQLMATLAELGLSAFDATVYDTPYGRMEFCAVLERRRPARRSPSRQHGLDMIVFQTADPFRYAPMLALTAPTVIEYCRRFGFRYESFVGIRRGRWNWQATYNRIAMFKDLLDRGHDGWALYLDADAWVHDLDFDLPAYLADKRNRAAILATSGVTDAHWDVNAGVMFVNFAHPQGRALVERWWQMFQDIPDQRLAEASTWLDDDNDQDLLHKLLRAEPVIADAIHVESMAVLNSRHARFIRQHLRAQTDHFNDRLAAIGDEVAAIFERDGLRRDTPPPESRWHARLAHRPHDERRLVEHPIRAWSDLALSERIAAAWHHAMESHESDPPAAHAVFADALTRRDHRTILSDLAGLGRARLGEGFLGGARQHRRAEDPVFARRLALWTHDKLVSLAEAVGALPVENPEAGRWGDNVRHAPADLLAMIGDALGIDPAPPAQVGGYLGIAAGDDVVLHLRIIDALHAAWRLRQLCRSAGLARICELGGGAGFTAHYARRMGLTDYCIVDLPTMNAVQAGLLGAAGHDLCLSGEALRPGAIRILPVQAFATLEPGSIDLLFNADSLAQIGRVTGLPFLSDAHRLGIGHFLSIDQEGRPDKDDDREPTAGDLVRDAGGWRLAARHRHWVRAGYIEEYYVAG